ncbi:hypothetical protein C8J56DRAFT_776337 [Mycena floridula]|nr:hypothetical protein C8J56DRAFT_776337 [Mycena floridula]
MLTSISSPYPVTPRSPSPPPILELEYDETVTPKILAPYSPVASSYRHTLSDEDDSVWNTYKAYAAEESTGDAVASSSSHPSSPRTSAAVESSSHQDIQTADIKASARVHFEEPTAEELSRPPPPEPFDEYALPTKVQLRHAAKLFVTSETGESINFGSLWSQKKTVVLFIRHFMCPQCQDYMFSISRNLSAAIFNASGLHLIIVSNGAFEMIKAYRKIFRTPFALYTDPEHAVYQALGMTHKSLEPGPRGSYIRHGMISGVGMVVGNAVKSGMPLLKNAGEISQLGGEFILGPGLQASFAHRMRYTRDHIPILDVVSHAGVDMHASLEELTARTGKTFLGMTLAQEGSWMVKKRKQLDRLVGKKQRKASLCGPESCEVIPRGDTSSVFTDPTPTITEVDMERDITEMEEYLIKFIKLDPLIFVDNEEDLDLGDVMNQSLKTWNGFDADTDVSLSISMFR